MKWPDVPIKDVCLLAVDCVNKTAPVVEYETPYRMLRTTNVRGGFVDADNTRFVTEETFVKWTRRGVPQKGDVILTREAPLGDVGRLTSDNTVFLGQRLFMYRADPEKLNSKYLAYIMQSPLVQGRIKSKGFGATVEHARVGDCENLLIPVPGLRVQERIGETLSAYDDLTENNKRRIELLEESARQLYKEWFVRFGFPGHEHVKIIDGVPEGWEVKKLGELFAKIRRAGKIKKEEYVETGAFPCVDQSQSFIGGYTDNHEAVIKEPLPLVIFGDHTRILKFVDFPFACGADGTQILYPNDDRLSIEYFYFSLLNVDLSNYFYARHFKFLKDQEILIPSERHVKAFTEFACSNMKQISKLRDQCLQLSKARDLLLPKLMSGEIAV